MRPDICVVSGAGRMPYRDPEAEMLLRGALSFGTLDFTSDPADLARALA